MTCSASDPVRYGQVLTSTGAGSRMQAFGWAANGPRRRCNLARGSDWVQTKQIIFVLSISVSYQCNSFVGHLRIYLNTLPEDCGGETSFERCDSAKWSCLSPSFCCAFEAGNQGLATRRVCTRLVKCAQTAQNQHSGQLGPAGAGEIPEVDRDGQPQDLVEHRAMCFACKRIVRFCFIE